MLPKIYAIVGTCVTSGLSLNPAQWIGSGTTLSKTLFNTTALKQTSSPPSLINAEAMITRETANYSLGANPISLFCYSRRPEIGPLNIQSCTDAVRQLDIRSTNPILWGLRHTGRHYQTYLPRRFIGTDGSCFLEPVLRQGHDSSSTSQQSIATAAIALIRKCVAGNPSKSGIAKDIGGDSRLALVLSGYRPQVQCFGQVSRTPSFRQSCQDILDTMDVSENERRFGPPTDPGGIDVALPVSLKAGYMNRCVLTLVTSGVSDMFSWIEIWEAATAINAVCVRSGRQGKWDNLGSESRLSLEISDDSITRA